MLWEFLICEETLGILLRSSRADQVPVDGIEFVLSSNDEEVSSGERHFGLADFHDLDIDRRSVDFFFEDGFFSALLRLISVSLHIIADHVES